MYVGTCIRETVNQYIKLVCLKHIGGKVFYDIGMKVYNQSVIVKMTRCFCRLYCRHYERTFSSAEEELLYFLERVAKPGWRWPAKPRPPEHHKNKQGHEKHNGILFLPIDIIYSCLFLL